MRKHYFEDCSTLEELKKLFKSYAFKLHPDRGGNAEEFKQMYADYESKLKTIGTAKNAAEDAKPYNWQEDQFADVIQSIINFVNMKIEVIGSWIWCFNAYEYHTQLAGLGFWYSGSKKAWVYSGDKKTHSRGHYTMNGLRQHWGSEVIETERREEIA